MPAYIVTCKSDATPEEVATVKKQAIDDGGKITHEYNLIKGFAVTYPDDTVCTLETHGNVAGVEQDQAVSI